MTLVLAGCRENEPLQKAGLPLSICLPANEVQSARYAPAARKTVGDPGETETFLFPHYLYIIVMKQNRDKSWSVWETKERTLTDADWEATHYAGALPTMGDSIYRYTEQIDLQLSSSGGFQGRVYAVASAEELSFSKALKNLTDLDDLSGLRFDASSAPIQDNLQHIYSSPYNLRQDGEYYGSFHTTQQKAPYVNLLLYHIAAKVDIKWSVAEDKRTGASGVRLTYMQARNLFAGNAYCFQPMRNVSAALLGEGKTIDIVRPTDEGLWWEGRSYFYTIPYTIEGNADYFPLQMVMQTNESGADYTPTLNLGIDTASVFVPWLRADFNLTKPLEAGSETKTIPYVSLKPR